MCLVQRKMAGALQRLINRKLSMAWERWQAWYEDLMEQRVEYLSEMQPE